MSDAYVQVLPDSTGKLIDTSELTVDGNTVERQRMVIADPTQASNLAEVSINNALYVESRDQIQFEILGQLKRIALLLELMTGQEVSIDDVD